VAEEKKQHEKSLEMRVAELEDKLAKIHITEEEMRAYHKVSNLLAGQPAALAEPLGGAPGALNPQAYAVSRGVACIVTPSPFVGPRHACVVESPFGFCVPPGWGRWGGGFGNF
jgi:hypothetical protein